MIRELNGRRPKIAESAFVSEAAYVVGQVEIGEDASVWPGAVIRGDFARIVIGKGSIVEDNAVIHAGEDLVIGDHVIVGHGAVVHGRIIHDHVLIGMHATVLEGAEVGEGSFVGAGAMVTAGQKIPDHSMALGSPAKVRSSIEPERLERLKQGVALYGRLAQEYKRQGL